VRLRKESGKALLETLHQRSLAVCVLNNGSAKPGGKMKSTFSMNRSINCVQRYLNLILYLSTMAMKGDTAKEEDAAAAISTLNNLTSVVRDFSVVAADSNDGWDNFEFGMDIRNRLRKEGKRDLFQALMACLRGFIWRSTGPKTPA
jgi:hypothetical protein